MKTLVLYYSYSGKTKKVAEKAAEQNNADIVEVKEPVKRSTISAYVKGSLAARKQKKFELLPIDCDLSQYDRIILAAPIWFGFPAPPMNNMIDMLPHGKEVLLILTSGSGKSTGSAEKTKQLVQNRGCSVIKYKDVAGH